MARNYDRIHPQRYLTYSISRQVSHCISSQVYILNARDGSAYTSSMIAIVPHWVCTMLPYITPSSMVACGPDCLPDCRLDRRMFWKFEQHNTWPPESDSIVRESYLRRRVELCKD